MWRTLVGGGLAVGTVAGVVAALLVGSGQASPTREVRLVSGAAWLSSGRVGQLTLLDGSSVEVAAQLQVAPKDSTIDVVQQGSTAYVVDRTAGTIRRVDGATFELTDPQAPLPSANAGLTAFAGPGSFYALDTERGVLASLDPRSLTQTAPSVSLTAKLGQGAAVIDDAGRLWVINSDSGDLIRIAGGTRSSRKGPTHPDKARLTLVHGNPVLVNAADRTVSRVETGTGQPMATLSLDLRPDDAIEVSGSPHADRLYLVTSRGTLSVCELGGSSCDNAIPVGTGKSRLGAAVEAGNRLFVPDFVDGTVWIVDLGTRKVVAQPKVLTPPGRFQLLNRDGVVFYNDPDTERAGVIRLDGGVVPVAKYDTKNPNKGLHAPPTSNQPAPPVPSSPPPVPPPPTGPTTPPDPGQPNPTQPTQPNPGQPPPGPGPSQPPTTTTTPPAQAKPTLRITLSSTSPMVNEDISLKVDNTTGPAPAAAHWTFGDGAAADGLTVGHRWATAQTYQITVQATMPDAQQATASASTTVSAPAPEPKCGDVLTASATLHADLTCPAGTGLTIGASSVVLDLGGHTLAGQDTTQPTLLLSGPGTLSTVTVKNGTVTAGEAPAVRVLNANDSSITNITVSSNRQGILTDGAARLRITGGGINGSYPTPPGAFQFDRTSVTITGARLTGKRGQCGSGSTCTISNSTISMFHFDCAADAVSLAVTNNTGLISITEFAANCNLTLSGNQNLSIMFVDAQNSVITNNPGAHGFEVSSQSYQISGNAFTTGAPGALIVNGGRGSITGNTFTGSRLCGLFLTVRRRPVNGPLQISGNTFSGNGVGSSSGFTCSPGDGMQIETTASSPITVQNNHSSNNGSHGIWISQGSVIDGGGNTSSGDPNGCVGVVCS